MNKTQIIKLYTQDQRIDVEYPDTRREVLPNLVRHIGHEANGEGAVIYSRLNESNVEETIRQQVAYFASIGQDFEWKVFDYDTPPDLKERLAAHSFEIEAEEAIMVLDLADLPDVLLRAVPDYVRRITAPEKIADVMSVEEQVWHTDYGWLGHYLTETITHFPELMSVYVAYLDGQPVSAAWIYYPKASRFASLWGGSTLESYRGRGLYTALLAIRAQEARTRQVGYLTVDASPMSRPILEKFGFEMIAYSYPCKWKNRSSI